MTDSPPNPPVHDDDEPAEAPVAQPVDADQARDAVAMAVETAAVEQGDPMDTSQIGRPTIGQPLEIVEVVERRVGQFGIHDNPDVSGYGGLLYNVVLPGSSERPYGGYFDEVADELQVALGESEYSAAIEKVVVDRDELTLHVRREKLRETMQALRDDPMLRFEMSMGVSGVHWPKDTDRELHAVYHLRSYTYNRLIRVETTCPDTDRHVPSTVDIYPTNDWHERETYDFFGIIFDGHPFLTRIEMPDDWPGHPQRKDYPLGGIPVDYKGATTPPPDQRRSYS